jgi:hypothetical protein
VPGCRGPEGGEGLPLLTLVPLVMGKGANCWRPAGGAGALPRPQWTHRGRSRHHRQADDLFCPSHCPHLCEPGHLQLWCDHALGCWCRPSACARPDWMVQSP